MNTLKKARLTTQTLSEKIDGGDLQVDNCLAKVSLDLSQQSIGGLSLSSCRMKDNVSFMGCAFERGLKLTECVVEGNLNISGCNIQGDIFLFNTTVNGAVHISSSNINGRLFIDSSICKKLVILNSKVKGINIIGSEKPAVISEINIARSTVSEPFVIRGASALGRLKLSKSDLTDFIFEGSSVADEFSLNVNDCRLDDLSYRSISIAVTSASINIDGSTIESISFFNSNLDKYEIAVRDSTISRLMKFKKCKYTKSKIDFSESEIIGASFDDCVTDFIENNNVYSPIYNSQISTSAKVNMLKIIKDTLRKDHQNSKEDSAYFILKNTEIKQKIQESKFYEKIPLWSSILLFRFILGWGVKLVPPLITSFIAIILYAVFCFVGYELQNSLNTITLLESKMSGVSASIMLSLVTFFGQVGDVSSSFSLSPYYHFSFSIFGVLMITLITGIIIRKLVR